MAVEGKAAVEIVGHHWVLDLLRRSAEAGRASHAYLLTGPTHVGRFTTALAMARILLCDTGRGCGTCRQCRLAGRRIHPDLSVLELPADRRTIPIKDVHDFCQGMSLRPLEAAHKVYIIRDADNLSEDGANALLKTLEEPPLSVTLILTAPSPGSLLETIVSRCQLLGLRPVAIEEIRRDLVGRLGVDEDRADVLARASEGRPGWAILAAQQPETLETRERRAAELLDLLGATRLERLRTADSLAARWSGHAGEVRDALAVWTDVWRDALLHREGLEEYARLPNLSDGVAAVARQLSAESVYDALSMTVHVADALERNANPRLGSRALCAQAAPGFQQQTEQGFLTADAAGEEEAVPTTGAPDSRHLCGVRRSRRGPVLWVACGDQPALQGCQVVVESEQVQWSAVVVVGRDQIIEAPQDLAPMGCVVRVLPGEDRSSAPLFDESRSAEELIAQLFPDR